MSICTFASAGHSPGQSATLLALAERWPRPVFLVEADPSSTSAVLAGRFRGQLPHDRGLLPLLGASLRDGLEAGMLREQSLPLAPDRRVVPGFTSLGAARGAGAFWERLVHLLAELEAAGTDALVDAGRLPERVAEHPLFARADLVLLTTGATLPDVAALLSPVVPGTTVLDECRGALARTGRGQQLRLLAVERARDNYADREIAAAAGAPVVGRIPWAPGAAAVHSHGARPPGRRERDRHRAAVDRTACAIRQALAERHELLGGEAHAAALDAAGTGGGTR